MSFQLCILGNPRFLKIDWGVWYDTSQWESASCLILKWTKGKREEAKGLGKEKCIDG